jgi:hypothetical protein
VLLTTRRSAVQAGTDAQRQLFSLVVAAPECPRQRLRGHKLPAMIGLAARLRITPGWDTETAATVRVLRALARRALDLSTEATRQEKDILAIVASWRPGLLAQPGVGPITAATILCAWSHPGRVRSEAAFAMPAGVAPIPAGSGSTLERFRLNRYGGRRLNHAVPAPLGPSHPGLRQAAHHRGQNTPADQTLPQALHRPRSLPPPAEPTYSRLTSIGASALIPGCQQWCGSIRLVGVRLPASPTGWPAGCVIRRRA